MKALGGLKEKLSADLKGALKEKHALRVSVLRMLLAQIHNQEIEKRRDLNDHEIILVLMQEKKRHQESITQFEQGKRGDLAEKEKAELKIIEAYLPKPLTEEELSKLVVEAIAKTGASGPADFGKVMKEIMDKAKGRAEGSRVSSMVKQALNKPRTIRHGKYLSQNNN